MISIDTEHGAATVWWDTQDPANPGWVLRYSNGAQDHLDEILSADDREREGEAVAEALAVLTREGIGAGTRLTTAQAAEVAGVTPSRWRGIVAERPGERAADGRHDARTPWWWETSVRRILASRPGRGARTDLTAGRSDI